MLLEFLHLDQINPLWILIAAIIYFLPSLVALVIGHVEWRGILFANVVYAWTILGWFLLFIWVADPKKKN